MERSRAQGLCAPHRLQSQSHLGDGCPLFLLETQNLTKMSAISISISPSNRPTDQAQN